MHNYINEMEFFSGNCFVFFQIELSLMIAIVVSFWKSINWLSSYYTPVDERHLFQFASLQSGKVRSKWKADEIQNSDDTETESQSNTIKDKDENEKWCELRDLLPEVIDVLENTGRADVMISIIINYTLYIH